ncbi:MAG TPA: PaaX family transcriptional regulator C-terminal domain-containing protein [Micromonosporaceae bacterium]|nr:PaaX family transcriptional regulator C-terminal domain-containing protein [Micromonosporaceae bacterium]
MPPAPLPPQSRSITFDVVAAYVRPLGGSFAVGDLIRLLAPLGVDGQTLRTQVSRLTSKGLLEREQGARYRLSPHAERIAAEGDLRIYARQRPAELVDGWAVAVFSVPEQQREKRHQLRSRLSWLGFGSLDGGVWLAPRRTLEPAVEAVREMGMEAFVDIFEAHHRAFGSPRWLVERCWDLPALRTRYGELVALMRPIRDRWTGPGTVPSGGDGTTAGDEDEGGTGDLAAFVDFTTALLRWRHVPFFDPGLPAEVLPEAWPGTAAAAIFDELVQLLAVRARRHAASVLSGSSGA